MSGAPGRVRRSDPCGLPALIISSVVVLAAVEGNVQRLVDAVRDVQGTIARRMVEQRGDRRMPDDGRRMMVRLEGEIHLGYLRPIPGLGARADPRRRATPALESVGRFVADHRVPANPNAEASK